MLFDFSKASIKPSRRASWQEYVSKLSRTTSSSDVWKRLCVLCGKPPTQQPIVRLIVDNDITNNPHVIPLHKLEHDRSDPSIYCLILLTSFLCKIIECILTLDWCGFWSTIGYSHHSKLAFVRCVRP